MLLKEVVSLCQISYFRTGVHKFAPDKCLIDRYILFFSKTNSKLILICF